MDHTATRIFQQNNFDELIELHSILAHIIQKTEDRIQGIDWKTCL